MLALELPRPPSLSLVTNELAVASLTGLNSFNLFVTKLSSGIACDWIPTVPDTVLWLTVCGAHELPIITQFGELRETKN